MPAKSKAQQRFMGMVHQAQKGGKAASPEVAKAASSMSKKDAKDFASTKHKGLPEKTKKESTMRETEIPAAMSNKVATANRSAASHDVDDFDRGGYPGKKHIDMQETNDPISLISRYSELGEVLKRSRSFREVAEQIGKIAETAEQSVTEAGSEKDWFDQHTIRRNMKELSKYSGDFAKIAEEMDTLHQRATALYDDMGYVLSRYFEIQGDTRSADNVKQGAPVELDPKDTDIEVEDASKGTWNNAPLQHQLKVARDTLRKPDAMANVMGGMTKDQARELLKKHGKTAREAITEDRKSDIYQARRALRTPKAFTRVANKMTREKAIETLRKLNAKNIAEALQITRKNLKRISESKAYVFEAMDPKAKEEAINQIVAQKQYNKIDGVKVDLFSANIMKTVMDNLSPSNKARFLQMPIPKMAEVAFKLVK